VSLQDNVEHAKKCHDRWLEKFRNRFPPPEGQEYQDEWQQQQCLFCNFYIGLLGALKEDWGVCSNPNSPFDGRVIFEHDGCEHFQLSYEYSEEGWRAFFRSQGIDPPAFD